VVASAENVLVPFHWLFGYRPRRKPINLTYTKNTEIYLSTALMSTNDAGSQHQIESYVCIHCTYRMWLYGSRRDALRPNICHDYTTAFRPNEETEFLHCQWRQYILPFRLSVTLSLSLSLSFSLCHTPTLCPLHKQGGDDNKEEASERFAIVRILSIGRTFLSTTGGKYNHSSNRYCPIHLRNPTSLPLGFVEG